MCVILTQGEQVDQNNVSGQTDQKTMGGLKKNL